jgi:hypothetical protein
MDIGEEIERITVEPLVDPVPRERPLPQEAPDVDRDAVPAGGNLRTRLL